MKKVKEKMTIMFVNNYCELSFECTTLIILLSILSMNICYCKKLFVEDAKFGFSS